MEEILIKSHVIKHLVLLKFRNRMDINVDLLHWFINFWIKSFLVVLFWLQINLLLKVRLCQTINYQSSYTNQLLENVVSLTWSKVVFEIKKVKNTVPSTYVTEELNGEEIVERVYKK